LILGVWIDIDFGSERTPVKPLFCQKRDGASGVSSELCLPKKPLNRPQVQDQPLDEKKT